MDLSKIIQSSEQGPGVQRVNVLYCMLDAVAAGVGRCRVDTAAGDIALETLPMLFCKCRNCCFCIGAVADDAV